MKTGAWPETKRDDMKRILIDGKRFSNQEEFYSEIDRLLTRNLDWKTGHNLDAFADLLCGGFGFHEYGEKLEIIWSEAEKSKSDLGTKFFETLVEIMNETDYDFSCDLKFVDLRIVPYEEKYKLDVFDFTDRCFRALGKSFEPEGRHSFYNEIENTFDSFWCLLADSKVIGTVALKKIEETTVELKALYLSNDFRGMGLGRRLMETAMSFAKEKGFERVVLDSMSKYKDALRLYENLGFRETERYNDNQYADVFMEKLL